MKIAKKALKLALGPIAGTLLGLGGKKKKLPAPLPQATRDDAAAMVAQEDELRRRQGAAADMLTGSTGAEAAIGAGRFIPGN